MPERPNTVFLLPDQPRAGFLGCYGAQFMQTPHIDSIADGGTLCRNAYSASPVCVPARVSLLTGMNAIKNGVLDHSHFLRPDCRTSGLSTWSELLDEAGHHTAAIGKMQPYPWDASLGFRDRIIAEDQIWIHIQDDYAELLAAHGYHKTVGHEKPEYHANHGAFVSDVRRSFRSMGLWARRPAGICASTTAKSRSQSWSDSRGPQPLRPVSRVRPVARPGRHAGADSGRGAAARGGRRSHAAAFLVRRPELRVP